MFNESSVTPIIIPHIAWNTFLKDASDSIGCRPTRSIDESGQELTIYAKFLTTLQEFHSGNTTNPVDVLKNTNSLLSHLMFSFLIKGSSTMIFKLLELTGLKCVSAKTEKGRMALLSGTLGEWKLATVDLCAARRPDLRWTGKTLLEFFFQLGLGNIFANYDREIRKDGTLLLKHKNKGEIC